MSFIWCLISQHFWQTEEIFTPTHAATVLRGATNRQRKNPDELLLFPSTYASGRHGALWSGIIPQTRPEFPEPLRDSQFTARSKVSSLIRTVDQFLRAYLSETTKWYFSYFHSSLFLSNFNWILSFCLKLYIFKKILRRSYKFFLIGSGSKLFQNQSRHQLVDFGFACQRHKNGHIFF